MFVPAEIVLATALAMTERARSRVMIIPITGIVMHLLGRVLPLI